MTGQLFSKKIECLFYNIGKEEIRAIMHHSPDFETTQHVLFRV